MKLSKLRRRFRWYFIDFMSSKPIRYLRYGKDFTPEDLYNLARSGDRQALKKFFREYVKNGQPANILPGYTARSMCAVASSGLTGDPISTVDYMDSHYGVSLYFHMWGCDSDDCECLNE